MPASWLPSLSYPSGDLNGYWSPVTSTINWCEEDYWATHYSAEIINAFTNLFFVYLAIQGIRNCLANNHDRIFLFAFVSYLVIGLGAFIFHTTLKYSMQLLDELSMIYTTCILFCATFGHGRTLGAKVSIAVLTTAIAVSVTGYHHYLGDPIFHQNTFALLTAAVLFWSAYKMEKRLRPASLGDQYGGVSDRATRLDDIKNEKILRTMWQMIPVGLGSAAVGFLFWNLDNIYCSNLRKWRRELGLPWGMLLECHGWWHFFTSISEYYNIVCSTWLRYCFEGRQDEVELVWPSLWTSVPRLERRKDKAGKAS